MASGGGGGERGGSGDSRCACNGDIRGGVALMAKKEGAAAVKTTKDGSALKEKAVYRNSTSSPRRQAE